MKNKNITLSENKNKIENKKILHCRNKMKKKIPFCLNIKKRKKTTLSEKNEQQMTKKLYSWSKMKNKNATLSEQNEKQKILRCRNKMKNKIYYTVGTK